MGHPVQSGPVGIHHPQVGLPPGPPEIGRAEHVRNVPAIGRDLQVGDRLDAIHILDGEGALLRQRGSSKQDSEQDACADGAGKSA